MSSFEPKESACVGQVLMQAGSSPTATRSEQSVHLYAFWSFARVARDVERAAGLAVAAADAVLLLEVDDAVRVLHDRAGRRARPQAARVGAVHAAVLHDEPLQALARELLLVEPHHRPGAVGEVDGVVVAAVVHADVVAHVVPLHARDLAGLAADALRDVDELRDLERLPHLRRRATWRRSGG